MKKVAAIALVVLILAGGAYALLHKSSKGPGTTSIIPASSTSNTNTSTVGPSSQAATTNAVTIDDMVFSPNTVKVSKGTKVTWTNKDNTVHTVTGVNGGPDSGNINPGKSYSFTFDTAGTFTYHCNLHSSMTGTVIVE